jgi:dipeptidase
MLQAILEECDTADMAVKKLQQLVKDGDYSHGQRGSVFMFMDSLEGYVCETTGKVCSFQRFDHGYAVRASNWHNPNMDMYSREDIEIYLKASSREYIAMTGLNRMLDETGKITLPGILEHSRNHIPPWQSPFTRSICGKTTNSAGSIEIDKEYPQVLSTIYAAIGPPRHTVYVPIPITAETIPSVMKNYKWSKKAFQRLDELKLDAPIPEEWTKFEKESITRYTAAKAEARQLLKAGKTTEAAALLNSNAWKIWKKAAVLLDIQ